MSRFHPRSAGEPRARARTHIGVVLAGALGLLGVAGCTGPGAEQAGLVAQTFEQLAPDHADQACDLLAGHTREQVEKESKQTCAEALGDKNLPDPSPVQSVEVYGHDARAMLGNDVVFLARFPEGWKVTAAGCKPGPDSDQPFDCDVSGG